MDNLRAELDELRGELDERRDLLENTRQRVGELKDKLAGRESAHREQLGRQEATYCEQQGRLDELREQIRAMQATSDYKVPIFFACSSPLGGR